MNLIRYLALGVSPALVVAAACHDDDASSKRADLAVPEAEASELSRAAEEAPAEDGAEAPAPETPRAAPERLFLPGPTLAGWFPTYYDDEPLEAPPEGYTHLAIITGREVGIYKKPGDRWPFGRARTGGRVPARAAPDAGPGCDGTWYEVSGEGYLCDAEGVHMAEGAVDSEFLASLFEDEMVAAQRPAVGQPNLFRHGKAVEMAPFLSRLPTAEELPDVRAGEPPSELVRLHANGPYVLALTREVEAHGEPFFQTIYGSYIRAADVEDRPLSPMHGERLESGKDLPLAFAWRASSIYCRDGDEGLESCGTVAKHARFRSHGSARHDGREFVLLSDELAVPRSDLRLATAIERPAGIGSADKWFHIDLSEQVITAYEGDDPVYTTLVSSGIEGFETPNGTYRVYRKYHSKTMRGKEPDGRPYQVQEVPWAMYFHGNYAAHGAYWHNVFGKPKSHGCVNIPPLDARHLYHWGDLEIPEGWHAAEDHAGTRVHVTGETPFPEEEESA